MRFKIFQTWEEVKYEGSQFRFWSQVVQVEGDEELPEGTPMRRWKRVVILSPGCSLQETGFSIGFILPSGLAKISTAKKRGQGFFAMRIGPGNCGFFVASNKGEVSLESMGIADIKEARRNKYVLY